MFIGVDIEDISRFENKTLDNDSRFLLRIFTQNELDYCFKNISNTSYLTFIRGIDSQLQIKYRIGYDEERQLVVFPINDNSYFARSIIGKGKYKSKGTSYLFNEDLIKNSDSNDIIYIT